MDALEQNQKRHSVQEILAQLKLLVQLEGRILGIIVIYAVAIGLCMLCVPLVVQELVSTFAYAVEPQMIFTLGGIVAGALTGAAAFRILQARAVETLQQRVYTRIALAVTQTLLRLQVHALPPAHATCFQEADLLTRALVSMVADLCNVAVVGSIFMSLLVFFHPYFLLYNMILLVGFVGLLCAFGQGGLRITQEMSRLNYELQHWIQNIAANLPHLQAAGPVPILMQKTDALTTAYARVRQRRSDLLTGRQYKAAALWQMVGHAGMIVTAGLLIAGNQLTVGQFAAAEILAGNLLLNMDTLARRMVHMFFAFVSFQELQAFFLLPQHAAVSHDGRDEAAFDVGALTLSTHNLTYRADAAGLIERYADWAIAAGEKIVLYGASTRHRTTLAKILAGLLPATTGIVRYNHLNLAEMRLDSIAPYRSLLLDTHPTLLNGTLMDNLTLGRPAIADADIQWALELVALDDDIDCLPDRLSTLVSSSVPLLTESQTVRLLLARALVTRPRLLIITGTLHRLSPPMRTRLLQRLCAPDAPWSLVLLSNDSTPRAGIDRHLSLEPT